MVQMQAMSCIMMSGQMAQYLLIWHTPKVRVDSHVHLYVPYRLKPTMSSLACSYCVPLEKQAVEHIQLTIVLSSLHACHACINAALLLVSILG